MRAVYVLFFFLVFGIRAWADTAPVLQELRSVELEREAQKRTRWIDEARVFYFENIAIELALDPVQKKDLEAAVHSYQKRFLTQPQASEMCGLVRKLLKGKAPGQENVSCAVENQTLTISSEP